MKQTRLWLTTIAALLCSLTASAHDFEVGGIYYDITSSTDLMVEVTYKGDNYNSYSNEYTGEVTIPTTVTYNSKTYNVTSIGEYAFYGCSSLTSITIPNSVTSIGQEAFCRCSNLKSAIISSSVTTIKQGVFSRTGLTSVTIPEGVTSLERWAFDNSPELAEVELPSTLTSIGDYAFQNCSNLTSITIPKSVTNIGSRAFDGCSSLTSITLPEGVTSIREGAFYNCSSLTSITLPEGVTSIGSSAFNGCSGLTSITLPESVTNIGDYAFQNCSNLTSITIPESVTSIGGWAFRDCSSLTSFIIPSSVTSIGDGVFQRCSNLASLVVKEGNTTYDSRDNCNAIIETSSNMLIYGCNSTIIPNSVTSIRSYAFSGCSSLTSITIPSSVTSIGTHAFGDCSGLTSITIPESVTSIANDAFHATAWYNNHPDGIVYAGRVLYKYKGTMPENTSIEVKEGTISILDRAFYGCSNLTSITLPEGVTSIGNSAFYGCSSLTAITLPEGVTSIGDYAFRDCSSLTAITLPEGVTSIGDWAFDGCISLTAITIPEGVTSIGYSAFYNCSSLTSITLPKSVTSIGGAAFYNCSSLTSITLPESVTSIGGAAFYNCSSLTSITLPEGVTSIGDWAFDGCISLQRVLNFSNLIFQKGSSENGYIAYYAKEVINGTRVGDYGFQATDGTNYLVYYFGTDTILSLPENYNGDDYEIAADVFRGKSTITSIVIPESVTSVGSNAFSGCSGLKSLFVGTNVDTYGKNVFEGCTAVEELTVMGSVMPMVPSDKFTTIRMFSPGPLDTEEFDAKVYRTATLYVPKGSLARYQVADVWKKFWYIEEFDPNEEIEVTLDRTTVTMTEGDVITLVATIIPQYIKDKTVTWNSSDTSVVTVDAQGVVTAVAGGTATITATVDDKEAVCVVTVLGTRYVITYLVDGDIVQTDSVAHGTAITLPEEPTKEGYTFSGWDKTLTTMPAEDVTISGTFTVNIYKVYYYVGEELIHTAEVAYGEAIPGYTYEPTGEGDMFEGWIGETYATMPAHDVTYVANITNGIDAMSTDNGQQTTAIYDLMGREVTDTENLKGGIYIVNGRKVVIK